MQALDYIVVFLFMAFLLWLGFHLSRKAGENTEEFILAGRRMPWWLAGTSQSASGLNASTMLQDSRKIRQDGLAGLWFSWQHILNAAVGAVWFTRLWRRARYTTQMEFFHSRYCGWQADFARLYDTLLYGIGGGAAWAAIGLVGMKKIAVVVMDLPATVQILGITVGSDTLVVILLVLVALIYSAASGVHGVVWTDFVEFFVAMFCSIGLMLVVYNEVGWATGLRGKIDGLGIEGERLLEMLPAIGPVFLYFIFIHPIFTQGNYNPQVFRALALKNEREVLYMTIYNMIVNFIFKPFPFYIAGLSGMFIFSDVFIMENLGTLTTPAGEVIPDYERVYPALVVQYLPVGLVGLMIAGFMSAFMSSFDTNIHNATAIFTNDLYRPYLAKGKTEKHYVQVSRVFMSFHALLALGLGILVQDILYLMMFSLALPISAGMVKLLRFIWWRVNGWGEVAAQITGLVMVGFMLSPWGDPLVVKVMSLFGGEGNDAFFVTRQMMLILVSTLVAVTVILCTEPEPMDKLVEFYKRLRPYGWWDPVIAEAGERYRNRESRLLLAGMSLAIVLTIFGLISVAIGLLLAFPEILVPGALVFVAAFTGFMLGVRKLYPQGGDMQETAES